MKLLNVACENVNVVTHRIICLLTRASGHALDQNMYIKKVKKRNAPGKKTYEYLRLVENVRTEKGPRQRLILNLGTLEIAPEKQAVPLKSLKAVDIIWTKRNSAQEHEALEGCYVLRTGRTDLADNKIWQTYMMLTRIERAFRSLKSSLGLRPNFHQTEQRADTHLFISVLAYHVLHIIEHRLRQHGDHRNWQTIRGNLSTHQRLTIEYNVKEQ